MKNHKMIIIVVILFIITLSSCSNQNDKEYIESNAKQKISDSKNIEISLVTAKQHSKKIDIEYPVVEGNIEKDILAKINSTIRESIFFDEITSFKDDSDVSIYLTYHVNYLSEDIISLSFYGNVTYLRAPHPYNFMKAVNIDLASGDLIPLSEIVREDELISAVSQAVNQDLSSFDSGSIKFHSYVYIKDHYSEELMHSYFSGKYDADDLFCYKADNCYYLTKNSIVVSLPTIHAIGEYGLVEIPFDKINILRKDIKDYHELTEIKDLNNEYNAIKQMTKDSTKNIENAIDSYISKLEKITKKDTYLQMSDNTLSELFEGIEVKTKCFLNENDHFNNYRMISVDFFPHILGTLNAKFSIFEWQDEAGWHSKRLFDFDGKVPRDFMVQGNQAEMSLLITGYLYTHSPRPVFLALYNIKDGKIEPKNIDKNKFQKDEFTVYDNELIIDNNSPLSIFDDYYSYTKKFTIYKLQDGRKTGYYEFTLKDKKLVYDEYNIEGVIDKYLEKLVIDDKYTRFKPILEHCYTVKFSNGQNLFHLAYKIKGKHIPVSCVLVDSDGNTVFKLKDFNNVSIKDTKFIDFNRDSYLDYIVIISAPNGKVPHAAFALEGVYDVQFEETTILDKLNTEQGLTIGIDIEDVEKTCADYCDSYYSHNK